jgi:hypothetical protein
LSSIKWASKLVDRRELWTDRFQQHKGYFMKRQ